jgi:hypothetical protein
MEPLKRFLRIARTALLLLLAGYALAALGFVHGSQLKPRIAPDVSPTKNETFKQLDPDLLGKFNERAAA